MRFSRAYLEITNICNRSCAFCPKTKRAPKTMTTAEFRTLAEKLRGYTDYLYLHVMGEPLTHPELAAILTCAGQLGFRIVLTTNGTLLEKQQDTLLSCRALHKIHISLHSFEANSDASAEEYALSCAYFGKKAAENGTLVNFRLWNLDGENTRGLHTQNALILRSLHTVFPEPWEENTWGYRLGDGIFVQYGERFDWPELTAAERRTHGSCYALKRQIAVLVDGTVVPCCLDHDGDLPLGNLFSEELGDILEKPLTQNVLLSVSGRAALPALCRRCGYAERFL